MDHKTASTLVRQLIGLIEPWGDHNNRYNTDPRIPSSSSIINQHGDRQMYLSRDHVDMVTTEDDGNYNISANESDVDLMGYGEDPDAEEAAFLSRSPDMSVWHTMGFIVGFFFFILCILVIKDGILKYFGIDCGVGSDRPVLPHNSQRPLDVIDDEDEAGLTPEEIKERRLEKQRMERRLWYSYYLKPYITVLTAEHFRTANSDKQNEQIEEMEEGTSKDKRQNEKTTTAPQSPSSGAVCVVDMDDGTETSSTAQDDEETATGLLPRNLKKEDNLLVCKPVGSTLTSEDEEELFPTKYMTLWDAHDTTFRKVEANCSICMLDYEEGDTIVKSGADEEEEYCIHLFHLECMLQWLSHGKKRCPICRHWFVPAQRIKEQMKNAHVVTRASLHHLYDSRTMQDIVSLNNGDDDTTSSHSMSQSFNSSNDTPEIAAAGRDNNAHHRASATFPTEHEQPNQTQSTPTDDTPQQAELPTSNSTPHAQGTDSYIDPESGQLHVLGHSSSC